jgi:hypothetical protein
MVEGEVSCGFHVYIGVDGGVANGARRSTPCMPLNEMKYRSKL